jgi:cysteine desulfurase
MKQPIYLDYAAATPMDERAVLAMQPYLNEKFYNPSAVYQAAREVRHDVEAARAQVADVLGSKDQEIIFTAGGTEANNLAIHGVMQKYPNANIVISSIEHESVFAPAKKYDCRIAKVKPNGIIDLENLEKLIDEHTVLVSVMYANNEIGTIQPIKEISTLIAKKRSERANHKPQTKNYPLYLHTDACQAANYLDIHVSRLGVDLMTLNGGKIYAGKQSGCLYVKAGTELGALISGGGQESNLRSGTENVASIIAFATMLQNVQEDRKQEAERLQQIRNTFIATLSQKLSNISLNGDSKKRLPNNINISIPNADGERLLMELDEAGILVATGSACTASNDEPSHVLLAIGLDTKQASSSLRITLGRQTTTELAEDAADRMAAVINKHLSLV